MKKTTVLLTCFLLIAPTYMVMSQKRPAFFMPEQEFTTRYEKLPPIPELSPALPSARAQWEARNNQTNAAAPQPQPAPRGKPDRYIAVDGRYIPVYDTPEPDVNDTTGDEPPANQETSETQTETAQLPQAEPVLPQPSVPDATEDLPAPELAQDETLPPLPEPIVPEPLPEPTLPETLPTAPSTFATPPAISTPDPSEPAYRKRYNQYLTDIQIFERSGQLPYNQDLETALAKMNSDRKISVYKGSIL